MDLRYKQEATVGTLVILAIVLFVVGTTWLSGRSVGGGQRRYYKIQFRDAANLKRAARRCGSRASASEGREDRAGRRGQGAGVGEPARRRSSPGSTPPRRSCRSASWATRRSSSIPGERAAAAAARTGSSSARQELGLHRPGRRAQRPGRQRAARRPGDREPADGRPALRDADGAPGHAQGGAAHDGSASDNRTTGRRPSSPGRMASFRPLSSRLDSTLANPALARTLGRADTLTGNLAAMTAQLAHHQRAARHPALGMNQGQGTHRQVRHRQRASTTTSGSCPSR